jgi:hypothetical protein
VIQLGLVSFFKSWLSGHIGPSSCGWPPSDVDNDGWCAAISWGPSSSQSLSANFQEKSQTSCHKADIAISQIPCWLVLCWSSYGPILSTPAGGGVAFHHNLSSASKQTSSGAPPVSHIIPSCLLIVGAEGWSSSCKFPGAVAPPVEVMNENYGLGHCAVKQHEKLITITSATVNTSWLGTVETSSHFLKQSMEIRMSKLCYDRRSVG